MASIFSAGIGRRLVETACVLALLVGALIAGRAVSSHPVDTRASGRMLRVAAPGTYRSQRDTETPLSPGGASERVLDIEAGHDGIAAAMLTTRATTSSALDQDATHGLRLAVERCSVEWVLAPGGFTCSAAQSTLIGERPVIGARMTLPGFRLAPGGVAHLRMSLSLPIDADSALEHLVSTIDYAFTATA